MKVCLAITLLLVSLTNGKPALENEVDLPQIKNLSFSLDEIATEDKLEEFTKVLTSLSQNDARVNDLSDVDVIDDFIHSLLQMLNNFIITTGNDPRAMADTTLKLNPTGTITLTTGSLQGASSITLYDHYVITYTAETVTLLLPLTIKKLSFTYKYNTTVIPININGEVQGKIDDVKLNLEIYYDPETRTLFMGDLSLKDPGLATVKFTSNDLAACVYSITDAMTGVVTTELQPVFIGFIERFVELGGSATVDLLNYLIHNND